MPTKLRSVAVPAKKKIAKSTVPAVMAPREIMISPIRSLAIRLESRLPMVVQQIGILILMLGIGAVASSLYLQSSTATTLSQMAFAIVGTTEESAGTTTVSESVVPEVTFDFGSDFATAEKIGARSTAGTKMNMLLKSKSTALSVNLPVLSASPQTGTWTFKADVSDIPAGEYRLIARVYYNDTWYEKVSPAFTISSTLETESDSESDDATVETAASTSLESAVVTGSMFGSLPTRMSGLQTIILSAEVEDMEIIVLSTSGKVVAALKPDTVADDSTFTFIFDTKKIPNGTYSLQAKFKFNGETQRNNGPKVSIENAVIATTTPVVATSTETPMSDESKPEIKNITTNPEARFRQFEFVGSNISFIEVYTKSSAQVSPVFNGLAIRQSDSLWRYTIDSAKIPNGTYALVIKYKQGDSLKTIVSEAFKVAYVIPVTTTEPSVPATITDSVAAIDPVVEVVKSEIPLRPVQVAPRMIPEERRQVSTSTNPIREDVSEAHPVIAANQNEVDGAINRLTAALRSGDESSIRKAKDSALSLGVSLKLGDSDGETVASHIEELVARAEKIEAIVKERTADRISLDTDNDGITDYDEITLYKTDPTKADTDADGFNDGAEILAGFNPLSSEVEVPIAYESPKVAGVSRPDLLAVTSVAAIEESEVVADGVAAQAEISGIALPNSYVTLFVFSTPVVVTLKTEADGSWMYTFDKELEDGEHEVYVGVTDNAGTIVAKSSPFRFIKEAQAFTPADASNEPLLQEPEPRGIESPLGQAAIFGLIIFIVGLILILLGQQLERSKRETIISDV